MYAHCVPIVCPLCVHCVPDVCLGLWISCGKTVEEYGVSVEKWANLVDYSVAFVDYAVDDSQSLVEKSVKSCGFLVEKLWKTLKCRPGER